MLLGRKKRKIDYYNNFKYLMFKVGEEKYQRSWDQWDVIQKHV